MRVALAAGLFTTLPLLAYAATTQSVTEQASYTMGDNDTRAQARDICLAKLERKALEASGSLVESEMDMISTEKGGGGVKDSAQQHVRSYVGAVVTASGVKDVFHLEGERIVVDCTATVTFNPDDVRDRLRAARADNTTKAEVDQQQQRIAALEAQVQSLTLKLASQAQAQALTQAQQPQVLAQTRQQTEALAQQQEAGTLAQMRQAQAYAQAQALTQIQQQARPVPAPRPQAALSAPPGNEPPPPAAQPRFQVEVTPLTPSSSQPPSPPSAAQAGSNITWHDGAAELASATPETPPRARSIRAGMSAADLVKVIGRPRVSIHEYFQVYSWDYGNLWVTINAGMVQCVSVRQNPMCRWVLAYK